MLTRLVRKQSLMVILATVVLFTGCAGLPAGYNSSGNYVVRKGDTLYSIAFRYGLDFKSLARVNRIGPPYTIYANQVLRLRGSASASTEKDRGPSTSSKKPARTIKSPPVPDTPKGPVVGWRWPLKGGVIEKFGAGNPPNKGIDISAERGSRVVATADGVVVYAGGNLRGYGKLVIIKHNENFLSAYGNNEKLLVSEGDSVKAGKAIARVGRSAANVDMLHFEVRRNGKPVNPLVYLPK